MIKIFDQAVYRTISLAWPTWAGGDRRRLDEKYNGLYGQDPRVYKTVVYEVYSQQAPLGRYHDSKLITFSRLQIMEEHADAYIAELIAICEKYKFRPHRQWMWDWMLQTMAEEADS